MPPEPDYYARLLRYDAWANAETFGSLRGGEVPAKAMRWMGHIVGSGTLWLARLRQEPPAMAVWPDLDLGGCAGGIERLAADWPRYLETLSPAGIEESVGYHVVMHGAYHRAQIAAAVREGGREPAYTDFIHAVRQGFLE